MTINNTSYDTIKTQNTSLNNFVNSATDVYSMEQTQFSYKTRQLPTLDYVYYIVFIVYWVVLALVFIIIVMTPKLSWSIKILILAIFAVFPFVVYALENLLYQLIFFIYSIIWGESYYKIWSTKFSELS